MKIAILTIHSVNYGNRLQNWALQTVLERMGHEVNSLRRSAGFNGTIRSKLKFLKRCISIACHSCDKMGRFYDFDQRIVFSRFAVSREYVSPNLADVYNVFIVGSDQVWNPDFDFNSDLEYLPHISRNQKISYAASFGVSKITTDREQTASYLRDFLFVSVRENAGADIVAELTGSRPAVVLDPTMLLHADDWSRIAIKPPIDVVNSSYILKYMLGDDVHGREIEEFARSHGLGLVDLAVSALPVGPAEFLWLVEHASLVCVDSFHGSVFSMLFHRPFIIYERQSDDADMSSRFDTLCRLFDMGHHRSASSSFDLERCLNEDWAAFDRRLTAERERSIAWLEGALLKAGAADA